MKIQILGAHNTESSGTRQSCLLVDDVLALDAGSLTSGLSFEEQLNVKAILITHGHYDHIRDIPAFAINLYLRDSSVDIYAHQAVYDNLTRYLLNGELYPEFHKRPEGNPTTRLHLVTAQQSLNINGYVVKPAATRHSIPTLGYQVRSTDGKTIFYTGDTGPELDGLWPNIDPQVLFIEVTASNQWTEFSRKAGHLTPELLHHELGGFKKLKGYVPRVIAVHINPANEPALRKELEAVAADLKATVEPAREGMVVEL